MAEGLAPHRPTTPPPSSSEGGVQWCNGVLALGQLNYAVIIGDYLIHLKRLLGAPN